MFYFSPKIAKDISHLTYIRQVDIRFWEFLMMAFFKHYINMYGLNWLTYDPNLTTYKTMNHFCNNV